MSLVSSTTQLLGIFVFYHAVWLNGMTYAKYVNEPNHANQVQESKCIEGSTWKEDCNDCTCENGYAACTVELCPPGKCIEGDTWEDDCNTCTCQSNGNAVCTLQLCTPDIMDTLEEMDKLQAKEDELLHSMKKMRGLANKKNSIQDKTTVCGADYNTEPGTVSYPEPPVTHYENNVRCIWTISSLVPLYFYFSKFNMENDFDFILARDGSTIASPELGKYSGKSLQQKFVTKGDAHITFESDDNVIGQGFVLHWRIYSAEEQCKVKNGTCLQNGNKCDGIITLIENSCEDNCACCEGEVE